MYISFGVVELHPALEFLVAGGFSCAEKLVLLHLYFFPFSVNRATSLNNNSNHFAT